MKRSKNEANISEIKSPKNIPKSKQNIKEDNKNAHKAYFRNNFLLILIITLVTALAYINAFDNELTSWDDNFYVEENPYIRDLSPDKIKELFTTDTYYMGNYHPLAMISLSIDYMIAGEKGNSEINPFIFHFTNIFIHILVSISVFFLTKLLFKNISIAFITALLFGVHTFHVESVAWVSERKDVLYALFFVLSLISYVKYIDQKKIAFYILALFLFVLSLFSKGQAVSLSITLIAVDFLRNRNLLNIKVIAEKLSFIALSIFFGLIAVSAQEQSEAIIPTEAYSFFQRIIIASFAFTTYILKLILPIDLSAINPYPDIIHKTLPAYYALYLIPALTILFLFFYFLKKNRKIAFLISFFIINIFLLLQFIPVGSAIYADRYVYIPSIAFFILIAMLFEQWKQKFPKLKKTAFLILVAYTVLLVVLTIERTQVWQNSYTLWTDTVAKAPKSVVAWNNLGSYYEKEAKKSSDKFDNIKAEKLRENAIECFSTAVKFKPDYFSAFFNRGVSFYESAKIDADTMRFIGALKDFDSAIKFKQNFAESYHYRANAKAELQRYESALMDFDIAISLEAGKALYYVNRGIVKGKMNNLEEAVKDFDFAEKIDNSTETIYSNRGLAKAKLGKFEEAILDYNKAINIKNDFLTAYYNRAISLENLNKFDEAIRDLDYVIKNNPKFTDAYNIRAYCYEKKGDISRACDDYGESARQGNSFAAQKVKILCN